MTVFSKEAQALGAACYDVLKGRSEILEFTGLF